MHRKNETQLNRFRLLIGVQIGLHESESRSGLVELPKAQGLVELGWAAWVMQRSRDSGYLVLDHIGASCIPSLVYVTLSTFAAVFRNVSTIKPVAGLSLKGRISRPDWHPKYRGSV